MTRVASRSLALAGILALVAAVGGCVEELPPLEGTTSLRVELLDPADPGAVDRRLPGDLASVTVRVSALDARGQVDTSFQAGVQVHVQYLGGLTPELGDTPILTIPVSAGVSQPVQVPLKKPDRDLSALGPTVLWIEDGAGAAPTFATGTSPTIWLRDPFIADISTPNVGALDELVSSPLERKQVAVSQSRHGDKGRLVVTSTYSQGYTVSDVLCQDAAGTAPCTTGDFDHLLIFTFGRPTAKGGRAIQVGDTVARFTGGVQEFNGLTELGFPQTVLTDEKTDEDRVPPPRLVADTWFANTIEFEKAESFLIEIKDATVCPLDGDFEKYKQWKLNLGRGCAGSAINVITAGVLTFDPAAHAGKKVARVVGALRPVNIGSFNVWIIYPRFQADLTVAAP